MPSLSLAQRRARTSDVSVNFGFCIDIKWSKLCPRMILTCRRWAIQKHYSRSHNRQRGFLSHARRRTQQRARENDVPLVSNSDQDRNLHLGPKLTSLETYTTTVSKLKVCTILEEKLERLARTPCGTEVGSCLLLRILNVGGRRSL